MHGATFNISFEDRYLFLSGVHGQYMSRPRCIFFSVFAFRPGLSSLFSGKENVHEESSWERGLMGEGGPSPLEFFSIFNLDV